MQQCNKKNSNNNNSPIQICLLSVAYTNIIFRINNAQTHTHTMDRTHKERHWIYVNWWRHCAHISRPVMKRWNCICSLINVAQTQYRILQNFLWVHTHTHIERENEKEIESTKNVSISQFPKFFFLCFFFPTLWWVCVLTIEYVFFLLITPTTYYYFSRFLFSFFFGFVCLFKFYKKNCFRRRNSMRRVCSAQNLEAKRMMQYGAQMTFMCIVKLGAFNACVKCA